MLYIKVALINESGFHFDGLELYRTKPAIGILYLSNENILPLITTDYLIDTPKIKSVLICVNPW